MSALAEKLISRPGAIRIGVAGWSYPDWEGVVYPLRRGRGFDPLGYLARYLDVVEINSSFYRTPTPRTTEAWVRRIVSRPRFTFTVKLSRLLTHEADAVWEECAPFAQALAPLQDMGRLSALLMQFPYSFRRSPGALERVERIAEAFAEFPVVLEVRHASWLTDESLAWLEARRISFANVDQPRIGSSISGTAVTTGNVNYVRFHGRNYRNWFREDAGRDARYDYLYGPAELVPWAAKVRRLASAGRDTFVIANNHFQGKAVVNALELRHMLQGEPVQVPPDLVRTYARLGAIAESDLAPVSVQPSLFES